MKNSALAIDVNQSNYFLSRISNDEFEENMEEINEAAMEEIALEISMYAVSGYLSPPDVWVKELIKH